jgi:hypothetical protein
MLSWTKFKGRAKAKLGLSVLGGGGGIGGVKSSVSLSSSHATPRPSQSDISQSLNSEFQEAISIKDEIRAGTPRT